MKEPTQLKIFYHILNNHSIFLIQIHNLKNISIEFARAQSKINKFDKTFRIWDLSINDIKYLHNCDLFTELVIIMSLSLG